MTLHTTLTTIHALVLPRTKQRFHAMSNRILRRTALAAAALMVPCAPYLALRAQSVPIPFAATYAGGGTVCSTSLPVFAVTGTGAKYGDGCPATQATLNVPVAVASDAFGNIFIADQTNQLIRVVYNGGTALAAALAASNVQNPGLVPVKGNIYTLAGGVTTTPSETTKYCSQAGSGTIGTDTSLDGCPASQSEQGPRGIATDSDGNVFISSVSPDSQVRVVYIAGTAVARLITLANPTITTPQVGYVYNIGGGNASSYTGDGALASKATLNTPRGLFIDANENVIFTDELNNVVRRIDSTTGLISTIAGHCVASGTNCTATATSGDGGPATSANIYFPYAVAQDQYGNIFIAEGGSTTVPGRIRVVYAAGTLPGITSPVVGDIYTYAGGAAGTTPAQLTTFQFLYGVSVDPTGYVYATEYRSGSTGGNRIWRIDPTTGNIAAIAGNGGSALTTGNHCNGGTTGPTAANTRGDACPATQAYLNTPQETLAFDAHGTFYVADRSNNVVRSFSYDNQFPATAVGASATQPVAFLYPAASIPTTTAFTTQGASAADYTDAGGDTCPLGTALPTATTCVTYVKFAPTTSGARPASIAVSSVTATLGTQPLAGVGTAPVLSIFPGTSSTIGSALQPLAVSTDSNGNVLISDGKSKQLLRTTIAGGTPTAVITGLGTPRQSTTDQLGNIYIADSTANTIVERTAAGATVNLGTGLSAPQGVAADALGNLYVADTGNNRLIYLSPLTGAQSLVPTSGYTLSAPTSLAIDATGDLYLIDTNNTRVLEIPFASTPQLVTLPSGTQPGGIAADLAGDLYVADKTTGALLYVPAGSTTATRLVTGLTTPVGLAISNTGNLFLADSAATTIGVYNQALNATTFPTTNIQLTSLPITLTLGNVGNLTGTLSTPTYVETGTAAAFASSGTPTCTAALSLAPAATCTQAFVFKPTTPGPQTAKAVFSTTTGQTATANFSATATNLILTTTSLALSGSGSLNYGQAATYTVTLTPASTGSAAPTGSIAFLVDGTTSSTQTVSTNPYTFTVALGVGTHTIAANYTGDVLYASSNATTSITIGKAVTATTASYTQAASGITLGAVVTPASVGAITFTGNVIFTVDGVTKATVPVGNGTVSTTLLLADGSHTYFATYAGDANYATSTSTTQGFTLVRTPTSVALTSTPVSNNGVGGLLLQATLSPTALPTGTITFSNGATTLGTVNLSTAVKGVVSFTTTTTTYTNYAFTAAYSGDGLYQPSTVTITQGPDFVVVAPAATIEVPQGGQVIQAFSLAPINGYTGVLTPTCTNLPVDVICRFQPTTSTIASTSTNTLNVQVFAGVNPSVASLQQPTLGHRSQAVLALLLLSPALLAPRRRRRCSVPTLLALTLLAVLPMGLVGCGIKTPAQSGAVFSTPVGTYTLTLTVTDANNITRTANFTINVPTL